MCLCFQIKLLHNATKPLFSNLIEQDSGAITAGEPMPISHNSNDYHCDDYKPVWDIQSVKHLLEQAIEEYNKVYPKIHLSLYDSTVQHICRLGGWRVEKINNNDSKLAAFNFCAWIHMLLVYMDCQFISIWLF